MDERETVERIMRWVAKQAFDNLHECLDRTCEHDNPQMCAIVLSEQYIEEELEDRSGDDVGTVD